MKRKTVVLSFRTLLSSEQIEDASQHTFSFKLKEPINPEALEGELLEIPVEDVTVALETEDTKSVKLDGGLEVEGHPVEIVPLAHTKVLLDPVQVGDGKYTFFTGDDGLLDCRRHSEEWPAFRETGSHYSGSTLALYHDLLDARKRAARLYEALVSAFRECRDHQSGIHPHVLSPWARELKRIASGEHD